MSGTTKQTAVVTFEFDSSEEWTKKEQGYIVASRGQIPEVDKSIQGWLDAGYNIVTTTKTHRDYLLVVFEK